MKRSWAPLSVIVMVAGVACALVAEDKPKASPSPHSENRLPLGKPAAVPSSAKPASAVSANADPAKPPANAKPSADDVALRAVGDAIVAAYQTHDAKAFAAVFTDEGEYVDDTDSLFHGRDAIEKEFATFFKSSPETTISVTFDAIRPIAPGVVKIQGSTAFKRVPTAAPIPGQCSLVCVKDKERWQVASLREIETIVTPTHHDRVSQVEWMIGEWINEGQRAEIHFDCQWDQTGNYLLREFSIHAGTVKVISGTQRIGYDPVTGYLKVWTFDSDGGFSDGYLRQENGSWILHTSGVTDEGHMASGTEVFAQVDPHRMTWDCVDRIIAGRRIPDTGRITVVRKPPPPAPVVIAPQASKPSVK